MSFFLALVFLNAQGQSLIEKKLLNFDNAEATWNFKEKIDTLFSIRNLALNQNEKKGLSNCYRRLGIVFEYNAQPDCAITYLIKAAETAASIKYSLSEASSLNEIGAIYAELQNSRQALVYFGKALGVYESLNDYRGMSDAAFNMAEMSLDQNKLAEAEELCMQSLLNSKKWGDTSIAGYIYELLSRICVIKNNPRQALHYGYTAVNQLRLLNDFYGLIPALIQLGKCQRLFKKIDSSLCFYREGYGLAKQTSQKKWIAATAQLLSGIYELKHFPDSAMFYLKVYSSYTDSIMNERVANATMNAVTRYDTEKKEMELSTQQKLTESSQALNLALTVMVILLLVAIIVLIRNAAHRKKIVLKESELQNANAMLQGQDVERERIARELHDRVGSMLSTVKLHFTSIEEHMDEMVKAQGKSYEKALILLDETYEEVRRISHDLDTGLLGRFGLRTAMMQLAQVIGSTNKLKVLYIDNDLAPETYKAYETDLYRITQELLSNTIKYASAREVSIQLSRNSGNLVYSYEDDGLGFDKETLQKARGIGYKNIEARIKKMQGKWHLDTSPGNGINMIIELRAGVNKGNNS